MTVVRLRGLSVRAATRVLLHPLDLDLKAAEICAIIGPNGAGKSTLLKAICGDVANGCGQIEFCDARLARPGAERARALAVLPQSSSLNFPFRVDEVVALGRIPHASGRVHDRAIVREVMQALDIAHLAEAQYTQLSGGERQRTQLARVMAQIWRSEDAPQRILLLDEPSTALDIGHRQQLMQALVRLAADGVAVLMVVHDVNIAARHAQRVVALAEGRCLACGRTDAVLTEALLQSLFRAELCVIKHPINNTPYVVS